MSAVACYQRNGKTGNLEMLAIDMTAKTDTMQVTDKHRQVHWHWQPFLLGTYKVNKFCKYMYLYIY